MERHDPFSDDEGVKKSGGGIVVYVRNSINYVIHQPLWAIKPHIEAVIIRIIPANTRQMILAVFYRPPTGRVIEFTASLGNILNELVRHRQRLDLVLMGDANIDFSVDCADRDSLIEFMEGFELEQIIDTPTRVSSKCSTIIDHIYIRAKFINMMGCIDLGLSDHYLIYFVKKKETQSKTDTMIVRGRNYQLFCPETIHDHISSVNWGRFNGTGCPNEAWRLLYQEILGMTDLMFPMRSFRVKIDQPPWYTDKVLSSSSNYNRLRKRSLRSKNPKYKEEAHKARNSLKTL